MIYCPVKIIFADQAIRQAQDLLAGLGSHALIVCGKASARLSGALADLEAVLSAQGIHYSMFDQISPNPTLEEVMAGKAFALQCGCNLVIGLGGGSPIDAAKAISLAVANDLQQDELYTLQKFRRALPLVAIPTTSGTGSEVTQYSVLTNPQSKTKAGFGHPLAFPGLALLDPRYTLSLPQKVTLHTALDALSHLLEGLYSNQREPLIYPLIYQGVGLIMQYLPHILKEPQLLESRSALMQASLYGGMVIAQSSTTLQHSIGYPLTTEYGLDHGLANAIVMEEIMDLYYPTVCHELDALFSALGTDRKGFIDWLHALPFSRKVALSDEFISRAIPQIMASRNMALNPRQISPDKVEGILRHISSPEA